MDKMTWLLGVTLSLVIGLPLYLVMSLPMAALAHGIIVALYAVAVKLFGRSRILEVGVVTFILTIILAVNVPLVRDAYEQNRRAQMAKASLR